MEITVGIVVAAFAVWCLFIFARGFFGEMLKTLRPPKIMLTTTDAQGRVLERRQVPPALVRKSIVKLKYLDVADPAVCDQLRRDADS